MNKNDLPQKPISGTEFGIAMREVLDDMYRKSEFTDNVMGGAIDDTVVLQCQSLAISRMHPIIAQLYEGVNEGTLDPQALMAALVEATSKMASEYQTLLVTGYVIGNADEA